MVLLDCLAPGLPAEVFVNITRAAPGISKVINTNDLILGVIISLFWIYLILWRLKFVHPNIWRPVVLSAGGLGLTWALLITLWGPALNINRGYQNIQTLLESFPKETICIDRDDKKLLAIVAAHTGTKIVPFDKIPIKVYANICSSEEILPTPRLKSNLGLNCQIHTEKVTRKIGSPLPCTLKTDLAKKIFSVKLKFSNGF